MRGRIIVRNAVKRKPYWVYLITAQGDLDGYDVREVDKKPSPLTGNLEEKR